MCRLARLMVRHTVAMPCMHSSGSSCWEQHKPAAQEHINHFSSHPPLSLHNTFIAGRQFVASVTQTIQQESRTLIFVLHHIWKLLVHVHFLQILIGDISIKRWHVRNHDNYANKLNSNKGKGIYEITSPFWLLCQLWGQFSVHKGKCFIRYYSL
jgi:hypothetical protein